jgi:hypothetical protein
MPVYEALRKSKYQNDFAIELSFQEKEFPQKAPTERQPRAQGEALGIGAGELGKS